MPISIIRADITTMAVDAIVCSASISLLGGGGADEAIHRAAGPGLQAECRRLGGCPPGQARLTRGHRLPCKYIIHTVGPIWQGGGSGEAETLRACYRASLALAAEKRCRTLALPLISAGSRGFPIPQALEIARQEIAAFLEDHELAVYLVVYDRESFSISQALTREVREYVDQRYVDQHPYPGRPGQFGGLAAGEASTYSVMAERPPMEDAAPVEDAAPMETAAKAKTTIKAETPVKAYARPRAAGSSLDDRLAHLDESFSQALLRMIDEAGITDAQCYKRANLDRKLFSKIRKDVHYRPSKPTAIALCVGLRLSLPETRELLRRAGYALSPSSRFDVIVEYFIANGKYDIFEINETLFYYDQPLLGC